MHRIVPCPIRSARRNAALCPQRSFRPSRRQSCADSGASMSSRWIDPPIVDFESVTVDHAGDTDDLRVTAHRLGRAPRNADRQQDTDRHQRLRRESDDAHCRFLALLSPPIPAGDPLTSGARGLSRTRAAASGRLSLSGGGWRGSSPSCPPPPPTNTSIAIGDLRSPRAKISGGIAGGRCRSRGAVCPRGSLDDEMGQGGTPPRGGFSRGRRGGAGSEGRC